MIIAFIFILWMMLLFTNKSVYDDYGMEISREWWVYIGSIVMIILICVLMVAGFPSRVKLQEMVSAQAETSSAGEGAAGEAPKGVVITEMKTVTATPVPVEAEIAVVEAEPIVVEAEIVEAEVVEEEEKEVKKDLKTKKPRLIEYPKKVPGGVYGDTIIRVDPRTKLNTRTLLVRSCMICDRQGKCWEEVQDTVPEDIFLENIECKKGLRKHKSAGGSSPG
ncbi:MAG: hypothetical protein JSW00_02050 [Thermoplasmata archaeon]|nr:MAG: hypothetical protein JSW00_02050 [Thermoplasmata archaeon]